MNDLVHQPRPGGGGALVEGSLVAGNHVVTAAAVRDHVNVIRDIMDSVMKENVHYGVIPGMEKFDKDGKDVGKRTLFKQGAEKICLAFQLSSEFEIERIDLPGGHREYSIVCVLKNAMGRQLAECPGVATTMEGKYRFRSEISDIEVPKAYWDSRDPKLLGGEQFYPRKKDKKWFIAHRVEHDNPADYYNTVAKMAAKRAYVGATILATAASDVFDQDVEDLPEEIRLRDQERESDDDDGLKGRPGQQAGAKAQQADPDRRKRLVEHVEGLLKKGTPIGALWAAMLKEDRLTIGKDEWERLRKEYPDKDKPPAQSAQPTDQAAAGSQPAQGAYGATPAPGQGAEAEPAKAADHKPAEAQSNEQWLKDFGGDESGQATASAAGREPGE